MKSALLLLTSAGITLANTAPTVVIQSATMRPGTTLMDVVYRVNDPDDATVKTRALAFVDGVRSFSKVIKPVTFVEGTAAKLGDAIAANTNHTLTWDVGADWNIDLGKVKFEVLAMDQRGLLPIDWISIPAAGGKPALTISKDAPTDAQVLNALFWRYAAGDSGLSLANGVLRGTSASGIFKSVDLASGATVKAYGAPFIFKRMNLAVADANEMHHATMVGRAGLLSRDNWHTVNRAYDGLSMVVGWPSSVPAGLGTGITAIATGSATNLALTSSGTVVEWDHSGNHSDMPTLPVGLSGVIAIATGSFHSLALKSDGTVVPGYGDSVPTGLSGVTAIAAGGQHSLALKSNGTVVGWGDNTQGQTTIPAGLSGVTAIAAGSNHSLALKSNGTVVGWGDGGSGQTNIPAGLSGVTAIAAGSYHSLALKSDGTVVVWGVENGWGLTTVPAGLSGVTAIAAGETHCLALKSDGSVVAWGDSQAQRTAVPAGLGGVTLIAAGGNSNLVIKAKAP